MALLRPRRARGIGQKMVERFEQQIAEAAPARIGLGKEVAAEAVRKELLDQIPGVLLGTTRAAQVGNTRVSSNGG